MNGKKTTHECEIKLQLMVLPLHSLSYQLTVPSEFLQLLQATSCSYFRSYIFWQARSSGSVVPTRQQHRPSTTISCQHARRRRRRLVSKLLLVFYCFYNWPDCVPNTGGARTCVYFAFGGFWFDRTGRAWVR